MTGCLQRRPTISPQALIEGYISSILTQSLCEQSLSARRDRALHGAEQAPSHAAPETLADFERLQGHGVHMHHARIVNVSGRGARDWSRDERGRKVREQHGLCAGGDGRDVFRRRGDRIGRHCGDHDTFADALSLQELENAIAEFGPAQSRVDDDFFWLHEADVVAECREFGRASEGSARRDVAVRESDLVLETAAVDEGEGEDKVRLVERNERLVDSGTRRDDSRDSARSLDLARADLFELFDDDDLMAGLDEKRDLLPELRQWEACESLSPIFCRFAREFDPQSLGDRLCLLKVRLCTRKVLLSAVPEEKSQVSFFVPRKTIRPASEEARPGIARGCRVSPTPIRSSPSGSATVPARVLLQLPDPAKLPCRLDSRPLPLRHP